MNDAVTAIIRDVRDRGRRGPVRSDDPVSDRLDLTPATLRFSPEEIADQVARVTPETARPWPCAAERIRAYHARQMPEDASWTDPRWCDPWLAVECRVGEQACMCRAARRPIRPRC